MDPQTVITEPKVITPSEVTGIIELVRGFLNDTERRIGDKLDAAVRTIYDGADERWQTHKIEHEREAEAFATLAESVRTHHHEAEQAAIARKARVQPIERFGGFLIDHWRDLLIFVLGLFALLGILGVDRVPGL